MVLSINQPETPALTREDASSFSAPSAFGPFRTMHQLGVGVLGPVYRTYDPQHDRLVAVKAFDLDLTPEKADAFVSVLQRLVQVGLTHRAIATPLAAGLEDGMPYLALQYVSGESLDVAIRQSRRVTLEEIVGFVSQLACGIDVAHERAVLHGSLHLRDLFVTADGLMVTGFGVARALEEAGLRPPVRRPYAAPEVIAGRGWAPEADRFSLASVAYELLTGKRIAGGGREIAGRLEQVEVGESGDSKALQVVFESGLADDAANRPTSAEHFSTSLSAALGISVELENSNTDLSENRSNPQSHQKAPIPRNGPSTDDIQKPQTSPVKPVVKGEIAPESEALADALEPSPALGPVGDGSITDETSLRTNEESVPENEPLNEFVEMGDDLGQKKVRKGVQPLFDFKIGSELPATGTRLSDTLAEVEDSFHEHSSVSAGNVVLSSKIELAGELSSVHPTDASDSSVEERPIFRRYSLPGALQVLVAVSAGVFGAYALSLFFAIDLPFGGGQGGAETPEEASDGGIETQNRDLADLDRLPEDAGLVNNLRADSGIDGFEELIIESASLLSEESSVPVTVPKAVLSLDAPTRESLPAASPASSVVSGTVDSVDAVLATQGGWILVRTVPPNSIVTVDGINRGQTPLSLRDVEYGDHRVVISAPEYESQAHDVVISSEATVAAVSAKLARESSPRLDVVNGFGDVFVNSNPSGATVLVDDVDAGVTPVLISDLESGDYAVRVEVDGYEGWTTRVNVFPSERTQVEAALIPALR